LRSLGRYEEALQIQRENLQDIQGTGDPDGYIQEELGECLLALGREEEAREHFGRAFVVLSQDPWLKDSEPGRLERLALLGRVQE
jgi:tetratricopeptide (TPR) repeat protein